MSRAGFKLLPMSSRNTADFGLTPMASHAVKKNCFSGFRAPTFADSMTCENVSNTFCHSFNRLVPIKLSSVGVLENYSLSMRLDNYFCIAVSPISSRALTA